MAELCENHARLLRYLLYGSACDFAGARIPWHFVYIFFPLLSFACALLTLGTFDIIYVQIFFMCCAKQRKK